MELSRHHADLSLVESLRHHLQVVYENLANPEFRKLALTWVLFSFAQTMGFVFTLYYNNVLKLTPGQLSLLPPLAAVVGVVLYRVAVPRLNRVPDRFAIPFFLALMAGGQLLLLVIPVGHMILVLLAVGLAAAGGYLGSVAINAALNNRMGALHKADAYSAVQLLAALATIPAGWLAGALFETDPRLALAGIIGVLLLAALAHALTLAESPWLCKRRRVMSHRREPHNLGERRDAERTLDEDSRKPSRGRGLHDRLGGNECDLHVGCGKGRDEYEERVAQKASHRRQVEPAILIHL